jgi:hypothetical protein
VAFFLHHLSDSHPAAEKQKYFISSLTIIIMIQQSNMSAPNFSLQQLCEKEEKHNKQNQLFNEAMEFNPSPLYGNTLYGSNNHAIDGPIRSDVLGERMLFSLPLSPTTASSSMAAHVLFGLAEKRPESLLAKDALAAVLEPIPINENNMTVLQGDMTNELLLDSLKQQLSGVLEGERLSNTKQTNKRPTSSSDEPQRPFKKVCHRYLDLDTVPRFRCYQSGQWSIRFAALLQFREQRGHCCVPHGFPENPVLVSYCLFYLYSF